MEKKLARYYDALPVGILVLDAEGAKVYANRSYATAIGADDLETSEAHAVVMREYRRRLQNRDSYTFRLVPDEEDAPILMLDLFVSQLELHGEVLTCITIIPLAQRERFVQTKERDNYIFDRMRVDLRAGLVRYGGKIVPFTPAELKLFAFLCQNSEQVFTKRELLRRVWGQSATDTRAVEMCVSRIRRKLVAAGCGTEFIRTQFGRGYVFLLSWER